MYTNFSLRNVHKITASTNLFQKYTNGSYLEVLVLPVHLVHPSVHLVLGIQLVQ